MKEANVLETMSLAGKFHDIVLEAFDLRWYQFGRMKKIQNDILNTWQSWLMYLAEPLEYNFEDVQNPAEPQEETSDPKKAAFIDSVKELVKRTFKPYEGGTFPEPVPVTKGMFNGCTVTGFFNDSNADTVTVILSTGNTCGLSYLFEDDGFAVASLISEEDYIPFDKYEPALVEDEDDPVPEECTEECDREECGEYEEECEREETDNE